MKKVTLCKAAPIIKDEPIEDVEIRIIDELPSLYRNKTSKEVEEFYQREASKLFDILSNSLPGGTRHQLLILLLKDTENLYRGI
jgi:hypothetical protein